MLDGDDMTEIADGDALFADIGAGTAFANDSIDVWRIAVPPSEAAATAHALAGTRWYADWAGGLIWAGTSKTDAASAAKLRQIAARADGYAVLLRASEAVRAEVPVFPPGSPPRVAMTGAVKSAFDPLGLFNPDRMFEGL
jgi:glycolate oxidase FAD binding subunit